MGAHLLTLTSGVLILRALRPLLVLSSSYSDLSLPLLLTEGCSLEELKPRGGLWGLSSGDVLLSTEHIEQSEHFQKIIQVSAFLCKCVACLK